MPKHLKKLSEESLHKNPWWEYKHDTYELPNGETGDYYYAQFSGMCITVPVLEDGRIVLCLQHRYLAGKQSIEFPGGGIIADMDLTENARRELYEETGCIADHMLKVGVFEPANGYAKDTTHVFIAQVAEMRALPEADAAEEFEVLIRRPDEIDRMVRNNEIWDGETLAVWAMVRHHFFKEQEAEEVKSPLSHIFKLFEV